MRLVVLTAILFNFFVAPQFAAASNKDVIKGDFTVHFTERGVIREPLFRVNFYLNELGDLRDFIWVSCDVLSFVPGVELLPDFINLVRCMNENGRETAERIARSRDLFRMCVYLRVDPEVCKSQFQQELKTIREIHQARRTACLADFGIDFAEPSGILKPVLIDPIVNPENTPFDPIWEWDPQPHGDAPHRNKPTDLFPNWCPKI